jgi:hypothetical protein
MSKAEKFIKGCTRNCSNELCAVEDRFGKKVISYHEWLTPDQARKAIEIAKEEELEYIKYQLDLRLPEILDYNGVQVDREDFIKDFVKAMKDE